MVPKFWEGLGTGLAGRVVLSLLTPAAVFWLAGLAAWTWRLSRDPGGLRAAGTRLVGLPTVFVVLVVAVTVIAVLVSAVVSSRLSLPLLRLLEGYWPFGWGGRLRQYRFERRAAAQRRANELESARRAGKLSTVDAMDLARLQGRLREAPGTLDDTMPTRFGNVLRAAELRPAAKYGLDVVACWPHLWLLLDGDTRTELTQARTDLTTAALTTGWSVAAVVWTPLAWWLLPAGPILAVLVYRIWLIPSARNHGDLVEAVFDLYRHRLYEALRWPLPESPAAEPRSGARLTAFIRQGLAPDGLVFATPTLTEPAKPDGT